MATQANCSSQDSQPWKCTRKSSRKLVVCIDGTSNKFGHRNTNIVELYSHIIKSDKQLTYYSSGLGTAAKVSGPSLRHNISNTWDMAIGRNLHKVIMASYRWLSDNYRDGDSVFLFGFSRGAYQVRALAGMISRVGLLLPGNNEQIPFAFELYSKTKDDEGKHWQPDKKDEYTQLAETFKETFCRGNVHIHFIGVWDTVSSVGFGRKSILPCTTTSCDDPHFCYFRHALALDERRVKFLPEYIYGGRSSEASNGRINEVWFAGCHGDVGGGNRRNEKLQLGDIPLLWMRNQAAAVGLKMKPADVMWKIDDLNKRITNSMRLHWWPMELWFFKHLVYSDSNRCTRRPHFGDVRRIVQGQKVHVSVLFKNNYKPFARFYDIDEMWPNPMFWNHASSHERLQELSAVWEKDIFDHHSVRTLLEQLKEGQSHQEVLGRLAFMSTFDVCKKEIKTCKDARDILAAFLNDEDKVIQLSTAAMYCELDWSWPANTDEKLPQQIMKSVSELLNNNGCRSACIYLPSLCKKIPELINKENLKKLVELCVGKRLEEETSAVTFPGAWAVSMTMKRTSRFQKRLVELYHASKRTEKSEETSATFFQSAHALSMLMELDASVAQKLVDVQAVPKITKTLGLHYKCDPVLVASLNVVDGLARHESRNLLEADTTTVPIICKLLQHYDDFVVPAAIRVLCSFLPHDNLRDKILQCNVLPTLCQVLHQCSDETRKVACKALVDFTKHDTLRAKMLECKVFSALFNMLQQQCSDETVQMACNALVESVKHDNLRDKILRRNVLPNLCQVLRRCSDETMQVVCNMLVEFVKHRNFRDKVLKHNVFPTLLDFSQWHSDKSKQVMCKMLVEFAKHDNLRDKMLEYKVLPALCDVLCQRSDETTQVVCNTLVELMEYDDVQVKMLECDVFLALFEALQDLRLSSKTVEVISSTLIESVKHVSLRDRMPKKEMFSTLCQVLRQWHSDEHKQLVCNTLVEFVKYANLRNEMLECDVFPTLCDILRARCWSNKTKEAVCNTLVELVKNDTARARMLECKVFPALFDMLHQQWSDETVKMSCDALVEFVKYEDKMLECDVFPSLGDVLRRAVETRRAVHKTLAEQVVRKMLTEQVARKMLVEQVARMTLTELVNHDHLQDKLSECIVLPILWDVLLRYSDETREAVYNTLVEIMKHENLDRMFTCKVLHIFCYALGQCESSKTKEAVCKKFVEFMNHDTLQDKTLECRVLPTLCYVVSQRFDETKQVVCKTVVLKKHDDDYLGNTNDLTISLSELFQEGTGAITNEQVNKIVH